MSLEPAIGADADWSITEDDLPIVRESYSGFAYGFLGKIATRIMPLWIITISAWT